MDLIKKEICFSILANLCCNDASIPFFIPRISMSASSCCRLLFNTLTRGMITEIGAISAEIFFVISSIGVKTVITLLAISS